MRESDSCVIVDGMNRPAYIAPRPGVCGPIRFSYRPLGSNEMTKYNMDMRTKTTEEAQDRFACFSAIGRLVSWNITYPENDPNVSRRGTVVPFVRMWDDVDPWVHNRIWAIIFAKGVTDIDPLWSDDKQDAAKAAQNAAQSDELAALLASQKDEQLGNS